jgi:hypothetical protein
MCVYVGGGRDEDNIYNNNQPQDLYFSVLSTVLLRCAVRSTVVLRCSAVRCAVVQWRVAAAMVVVVATKNSSGGSGGSVSGQWHRLWVQG